MLTIDDWVLNPPPSDDKFTPIVQGAAQDQLITDECYPGLEIRIPAGVTIVGWDGVPKTRLAVERSRRALERANLTEWHPTDAHP